MLIFSEEQKLVITLIPLFFIMLLLAFQYLEHYRTENAMEHMSMTFNVFQVRKEEEKI